MKVNELMAWYLARKEDGSERRAAGSKKRANQVKPLIAALGDLLVKDLNGKVLDGYRAQRHAKPSRRGGPLSHATINRELTYLRAALRQAHREDMLDRVPYVRMVPETGRRVDWWTPEQFKAVIERLQLRNPVVADVVMMYYETGWRKQEVLQLRWEEVHWSQGVVMLPEDRTKTEERRILPIEGRVREILERRRVNCPLACPWVFHRDGKQRKDFRRAWDSARRAIGCWNLVHGFRRTFARNQRLAGVPFDVTMKLAGWKTDSIRRTYAIVDEGEMRAAMQLMRKFLGTSEGSSESPPAAHVPESA